MWLIQELIAPLVIAGLLAFVLNPMVAYVNRFSKLPRQWVVALVYILIIGTLAVLTVTFAPVAVEQAQGLTAELQIVQDELILSLNQQADNFDLEIDFDQFGEDLETLFGSSPQYRPNFPLFTGHQPKFGLDFDYFGLHLLFVARLAPLARVAD